MTTIPASDFVRVTPSVLSAGGSALDLNGLLLTTSNRVPIGTVQSFGSEEAVSDFFGASSDEATLAGNYFDGFDNSTAKPGSLLIAQYPEDDVYAYLRGDDVSTLTVAEIQALSGALGLTVDGSLKNSSSISLAAATGFSSAAAIIANALSMEGPQVAAVTGSIAGGTLTVTAVASGSLAVGDVISGTGVVTDTYITALVSGTGGTGTYSVSTSQTALSQSITVYSPAVSYDSTSGGFIFRSSTTGDSSTITFGSGALATSLKLTQVTGAVLSQGTAGTTPAEFMDALVDITQNWATFTTVFDPDASGNTNKLAFAEWTSGTDDRYAYVAWDTDASPAAAAPATSSLGYLVGQANYSGTIVIGQEASDIGSALNEVAAFVLGLAASLDFERLNGRATFAYRSQSGLVASTTTQTAKDNLVANGYNFYGAVGAANEDFVFFYPGSISGDFEWADSYVNEIWLNNAMQLALLTLLTNQLSIPYNAAGNAIIEAALADPINAAVNFGAIRAGVELSSSQRAAVNSSAGADVATTIEQRGWYLQVLPASAAVRQARGSPPATLWYTDGQSVQTIELSSIAIQ